MRGKKKTKKIVILGAGFAGVRAALDLGKTFQGNPAVKIVLVTKRLAHEYHASFYEVATAVPSAMPSSRLRVSTSIGLKELLRGLPVRIVQAEVRAIKLSRRVIETSRGDVSFNALIVSLGSAVNYFGIPGLEKHSLVLKSLADALEIRRQVTRLVKRARHKPVRVVIAGGGFTGCELAGELVNFAKHLSWEHHGHGQAVEVRVVEGCPQLLPGLPASLADLVENRLQTLGVLIDKNHCVVKAEKHRLIIQQPDGLFRYPYDLLIWNGGILASLVVRQTRWKVNQRGQVLVTSTLQVRNKPGIFVVGDNAAIKDPRTNRPVPAMATAAADQGRVAAENVKRFFAKQQLVEYRPRRTNFLIPVSGKYAIADYRWIRLVGWLGWLVRRLTDLRYFISILPFWRALSLWWQSTLLYVKND